VLVDDVLGHAILAARPADHWSVSTEIAVDFVSARHARPKEGGRRLSGGVWARRSAF